MIAGEPRVIEQDGEQRVVDADGALVVCRPAGRSVRRVFHRVDPDAMAAGRVVPACHCRSADKISRLEREVDLSPQWRGCEREPCFGEAWTNSESARHSTVLEEMSPEAFEEAQR